MNNKKQKSGFTLIEIAISVLIIMVLATGAMGYQYYSVRDVRLSEVQTTAARVAMLLLEGWKGDEGASDFDPVSVFSSEITIDTETAGPSVQEDGDGVSMTLLGYYEIEVEEVALKKKESKKKAVAKQDAVVEKQEVKEVKEVKEPKEPKESKEVKAKTKVEGKVEVSETNNQNNPEIKETEKEVGGRWH